MSDSKTTHTDSNIREQLRVGVRMLEALELQLNRAEDTIKREEEARRRAEDMIERLETMVSQLRTSIDSSQKAPKEPQPPLGIRPSSGSLQASPRQDVQVDPSPNETGTEELALMLRRLASQLISASDENSSETSDDQQSPSGIVVKRPVEFDVRSSDATEVSPD